MQRNIRLGQSRLARILAVAATLTLAGIAEASDSATKLLRPVLGYVFDTDSQTIREATGVPGAASLGGVVQIAEAVHGVTVSSAGRAAIVHLKDESLALVRWSAELTAPAVVTGLNSALSGDVKVAFSADGHTVVLADAAAVEVWSAAGEKLRTISAAAQALAVNNAGTVAIATAGAGIAKYTSVEPEPVMPGDFSAVAFASNGDLLVADAAHLELARIAGGAWTKLASLTEAATAIVGARDGSAVAVIAGQYVVVVPAAGDAVTLDMEAAATGASTSASTSMDALNGNLVAALTGTNIVLDADGAAPRLTTVIRLQAAGGSAQ